MKNQSLKNRTVGLLLFFGLLSLIVRGQFIKKIDSLALVHHNKGFNGNVLFSSNPREDK